MVEGLREVPQWRLHDPPPWDESSALNIFTDASNYGMGGYCHPDWFACAYVSSLHRALSLSINWREMYAAVTALATWGPRIAGRNVWFHIDNQSVVAGLSKKYSPVPPMMALIRAWCLLLVRYDINPRPIYINTHQNIDADDLSRGEAESFRRRRPDASPTPTWPNLIEF